jgi:hypothetical protein
VAQAATLAKLAAGRITLLHAVEIPGTEIKRGVFAAVERLQAKLETLRERAQSNLAAFGTVQTSEHEPKALANLPEGSEKLARVKLLLEGAGGGPLARLEALEALALGIAISRSNPPLFAGQYTVANNRSPSGR